MVRPHGPVLESELVGYRLYFNEKQTPDIYGKFNKGLEIKESQFYPTDEQLTKGFGDDVLRVFDSCGPGALKVGMDRKQYTSLRWRPARNVSSPMDRYVSLQKSK